MMPFILTLKQKAQEYIDNHDPDDLDEFANFVALHDLCDPQNRVIYNAHEHIRDYVKNMLLRIVDWPVLGACGLVLTKLGRQVKNMPAPDIKPELIFTPYD